MPTAKPIVIMGAGPAGLTAAWRLIHGGYEAIMWEADASYVGGLSRTVQAEGFRIDLGGHRFFSKSNEVTEVWKRIMPDDFVECPVTSRVYHKGRYFNFPLKASNGYMKWGLLEGLRISGSRSRAQAKPIKPVENFTHWAVNRFGQRLFDRFYRPYVEKIWGVPCDELSADWAEQSLLLNEALFRPFDENTTAGASPVRGSFYPKLGPGQMWETAANKVLEKGGQIFLDRKVQTIHWDESGVTHITGTNQAGEFFQQEGSNFLSSMPLRDLMLSLDPPAPKEVAAAARALRYRDFITVCLVINREKVFPDNWIYVHDNDVKVARVQNYKNWSRAMVPDPKVTSLGFEYFCFEDDALWSSTDYDLAQLAIRESIQLGLVREAEVKDAFVIRTPKAYPIYDRAYAENVKTIREWVSLFANLQPLGRNGLHRYNNQDHAMMTAMLAVKNVQGGDFDCWKVTTDAQYPTGSKT